MEFYKLYKDSFNYFDNYDTVTCIDELNEDIERNPQWMNNVVSQTTNLINNEVLIIVLVRWVGLKTTPFKEGKINE